MGLHFLAFWPFGLWFPFILAFWAFISLHFCLLGLHFLAFWPFGPWFRCILAFWWPACGLPPYKLPKIACFPNFPYKEFNFPSQGPVLQGPPYNLLIHCHPLPRHFPSFPFILAFWAFISFHFWPFGPSFPFILALWAFISFHFCLLGLHFLAFWPFGRSFPCILAFFSDPEHRRGISCMGLWNRYWGPKIAKNELSAVAHSFARHGSCVHRRSNVTPDVF